MIARQAVWLALGQATVVIAGLAGTRVLTTLLSPADYGEVSLVLGLAALGMGLLCTPFLQATLRAFPDARDAGQIGALRALAARYLRRGVTGIAILLVVAGAGWTLLGKGDVPIALFVAAGFVVAFDAWRNYESVFLNGARRQRDYALRAAFDALARNGAAIGLVVLVGASALPLVLGFAVGSAAVGVLLQRQIVVGDPGVPDSSRAAWMGGHNSAFLKYATPLIPLAVLNWTMSMGDRYVLAANWGTDVVGVYWAAYVIGSQPFIAASSLVHTTLRPVLYDAVARADLAKERRVLRSWILVTVGIAAGGWLLVTLLAHPLAGLLLGPSFRAAAELMPWIAAAYALQMLQQSFEIILFAHGESRKLLALQVAAAVSAIALFLLLIPGLGALGAALGTLGSVAITTLLTFVVSGAAGKLFGPLR
jgi:O-antigen/teichoic acid export membrane protein